MTDRNCSNDFAARQFMTMDILENVLERADHPGKLASYLTMQMRELLGGRMVVLMECISTGNSEAYQVANVCPGRLEDSVKCPEMDRLAALSQTINEVSLWGPCLGPVEVQKILEQKEWNHTIVLPLSFNEQRVGVLFVFDLYELHNVKILQNTLETLMRVIAMTLRNSYQYENLEKIILERTRHFEEARLKAEAANMAKSKFLANMSHETRTPLNGLMGMIQLLELTQLTEEQEEYVHLAQTACQSLLQIISDILDFSTIEVQKVKLNKAPFCLRKLIHEINGLFTPSMKEKGLNFSCSISPEVPDQVSGDAFRLRQVLTNILGNAVKFTDQGKISIAVESEVEDDSGLRLNFKISDTGIGIPESAMEQLFDRFYQADNSDTRVYGGTGLGLAISKGLLEMMDGHIHAKSQERKGTVFHFDCRVELPE